MEKFKYKNSKHPYTHPLVLTHSNLFSFIPPSNFSLPSRLLVLETNHRHHLIASVNVSMCISKT